MKKFRKNSFVTMLAVSFVAGLALPLTALAATAPDMGAATTYAVFGKGGVSNDSNVGTTHIWGNVGADATNVTNLSDANQVDGVIDAGAGVEAAILSAYGVLSPQPVSDGGVFNSLAGTHTIGPGVYDVAATTLDGVLTLDGAGVYIIRSSSSISATAAGVVSLINGASACNVFWQVPTAFTIAGGAHIEGTIITSTSFISLGAGAVLKGRALARTNNVTMSSTQITAPCAATASAPVPGVVAPLPPVFTPPLINVTKIPTPLALPNGPGSVTYDYVVTNVGTVPIFNVAVTDNKCAPVSYVSGDTNANSRLGTTETWRYRCTTTLSQTTANTVTATGQGSSGLTTTDTADAIVVVGAPLVPPLIHLVKVPNVFVLPAGGGAVTYSYSVTNPGTVPLSDISITDNKCTGLPSRVVGHPGDINKNNLLDPGETFHFTCQTNLTQTTTNIGTATGHANGFTITDTSPATVVVAPSAVVPKLPNTGFPSSGTSTPWDAVIAIGILMLVSSSLVALKKHTV